MTVNGYGTPDMRPLDVAITDLLVSAFGDQLSDTDRPMFTSELVGLLCVDPDIPVAALLGQLAYGAAFALVEHADIDDSREARRTIALTMLPPNAFAKWSPSGELELFAGHLVDLVGRAAQQLLADVHRR